MYLHHDKRLIFLAQPKTASKAVATALGDIGFVDINGQPCLGVSDYPHHVTVAEMADGYGNETEGWTTFSFVRNHWDAVVSWVCSYYGLASVAHEGWSAEFIADLLDRMSYVNPTTLWHRHLHDSDHVLRYENLDSGLAELLQRHGLECPALEMVGATPTRAARPYQVFYTPDSRRYVAERFGEEIAALGYRWEDLPL